MSNYISDYCYDEDVYPLTIICDRYTGVYSGGLYTAWNLNHRDIPDFVDGDDVTCMCGWYELSKRAAKDRIPVGIGATPDAALEDLKRKLR